MKCWTRLARERRATGATGRGVPIEGFDGNVDVVLIEVVDVGRACEGEAVCGLAAEVETVEMGFKGGASCEDVVGGETIEVEVRGVTLWTESAFCEALGDCSEGGGGVNIESRVNGRVRAHVSGGEDEIVEVEGAIVGGEVSLVEVGGAGEEEEEEEEGGGGGGGGGEGVVVEVEGAEGVLGEGVDPGIEAFGANDFNFLIRLF
jgi:hypothetical protein